VKTDFTEDTLLAANIDFIEELSHGRTMPAAVKQYLADRFLALVLEGISLTVADDDPVWTPLIAEYKNKHLSLNDSPTASTALSRLSWQLDQIAERSNVYGA
jgi:hypothetical protein